MSVKEERIDLKRKLSVCQPYIHNLCSRQDIHITFSFIHQVFGSSPYQTTSVFNFSGLHFHALLWCHAFVPRAAIHYSAVFPILSLFSKLWISFSLIMDVVGTWTLVFLCWVKCSRLPEWGFWGVTLGSESVNRILSSI